MKHFWVHFALATLLVGITTCKQVKDIPSDNAARTVSSFDLAEKLRSMGFTVQKIPNDHEGGHIQMTYELYLEQPIDHSGKRKGTFQQKIYLSHADTAANTVLYLSGYNSTNNRFLAEPTYMFKANQIHVEHRFFGDSSPKNIPYDFLTIEQSAADHHRIVELLKGIYAGPWLNTGISKGGQTTMYHRYFYPEDVDASLVYVAPLNLEREDHRIYEFLAEVGEKPCRDQVLAFQLELLLNYDFAFQLFKRMSEDRAYEYGLSMERAFELSIFEYGFAFWQWNGNCSTIPPSESSFEEKLQHLFDIDAPGFFTASTMTDIFPFFYQSYTEMGMYGYAIEPFKELTNEYTEDFSNYRTFIPETFDLEYNGTVHQQIKEWLDTEAEDIAFIYGEYDPWSATGYEPTGQNNLIRWTIPEGNHTSRIAHLDPQEIEILRDSLIIWLNN